MKKISLFLIYISLFTNCNTTKTSNSKKNITQNNTELNGEYLVTSIYEEDVSTHKLTIKFNPTTTKISGFSGCNSYSCNYTTNDKELSFKIPIATKRMCLEPQIEENFFKALSEITLKKTNQNKLELFNSNNNKLITATKQ